MRDTAALVALKRDTASLRAHINRVLLLEGLLEATPINNSRLMATEERLRHM